MKIKLFILGLVFAFIGFTSFTSAGTYTYNDLHFSSSYSVLNIPIPHVSYNYGKYVYFSCSGYIGGCTNTNTISYDVNFLNYGGSTSFTPTNYLSFTGSVRNGVAITFSNFSSSSSSCSFNFSCSFSGDNVINQEDLSPCPTCPTCPSPTVQCSETEKVSDAINNIILYTGSVSLNNSSYTNIFNYGDNGAGTYCIKLTSSSPQTLTFGFANGGTTAPTNLYQLYNDQYSNYVCLYGNKSYFNAKLNSSSNTVSYEIYKLTDLYNEDICINNEIVGNDCDTCESSLGACLEDNLSLENMNESLSSQLEACLLGGGNGCDPEVDTGCITGAFQVPLLSWSVGLDSFTTPIINNLVLPTNYKGKLVDGVLTISSINNNLSISDQDMASIKDSIVEVLEFIFGLSLFLVLIYYIKFYMFNSK